jgi:glyoxalase family protein
MEMSTPEPQDGGILGIHHVTAIAADPRTNVGFYTDVVGQRMVKKTVNFDDPGSYHLYYGDELGRPGSIMTFFAWPGAPRGERGLGQVTVTAYAVPAGSLGFWEERLGAAARGRSLRFGDEVLTVSDPDGLELELVEVDDAGARPWWPGGPVAAEHAVRNFAGVTLTVRDLEPTARLLDDMGLRRAGEAGSRVRFVAGAGADAAGVDVVEHPTGARGRQAAGIVHHVAWRVSDDAAQLAWRERLLERGLAVTEVRDRRYFRSIYFREPGGVLFEIATDPPGFTRDETPEALGTSLKLPPWLEKERARIEGALPPLDLPSSPDPTCGRTVRS